MCIHTLHQGQLSWRRAVSVTNSRRPVHRIQHRAAYHHRPLCMRYMRCIVVFSHIHGGATLNAGPLVVRAAGWRDDIDGPRPTKTVLPSSRHSLQCKHAEFAEKNRYWAERIVEERGNSTKLWQSLSKILRRDDTNKVTGSSKHTADDFMQFFQKKAESVIAKKYPLRFDLTTNLSKHEELTINSPLRHIQRYSSATNVVCDSLTNCVLLQLPASSIYGRPYSRAFNVQSYTVYAITDVRFQTVSRIGNR